MADQVGKEISKLARSIPFCHTKKQCDQIARYLQEYQIEALAIPGDLEQHDRDQVLVQFGNHSCSVLVATDVAARGLYIKVLAAVINFELAPGPEIYIHRIGRTGRAGATGLALSLFTESERAGLAVAQVGKIDIFDITSYVAIDRSSARQALNYFVRAKVTGRSIRARIAANHD